MTVSINFVAEDVAAWASTSTHSQPGKVALFMGGRPCGYMTPENARHLAAELLREADKADEIAKLGEMQKALAQKGA